MLVLIYVGFEWTVNRIYVEEGTSLQLRYKGPLIFGSRERAKTGFWAEEGANRYPGKTPRARPTFLLPDLVGKGNRQ